MHKAYRSLLTIEMRLRFVDNKELGAVGVGTAVGHADHAALVVFQHVIDLVWELAVGCIVY